jgi:hypothetical protein
VDNGCRYGMKKYTAQSLVDRMEDLCVCYEFGEILYQVRRLGGALIHHHSEFCAVETLQRDYSRILSEAPRLRQVRNHKIFLRFE